MNQRAPLCHKGLSQADHAFVYPPRQSALPLAKGRHSRQPIPLPSLFHVQPSGPLTREKIDHPVRDFGAFVSMRLQRRSTLGHPLTPNHVTAKSHDGF